MGFPETRNRNSETSQIHIASYATFGSNVSSGVFGPIFPSFTRRATIEPILRLCVFAIW